MDHLIPAICEKLGFRGQPCHGLEPSIARKEARRKALWTGRLAHQVVSLPPFEQVFRALSGTLLQADLPCIGSLGQVHAPNASRLLIAGLLEDRSAN